MKDKAGLQCAARVLNSVQKAWFLRILFGGAAPGIPDRLSCCLNLRSGTRTICASPIIRGRLSTSTCHAFLFLPASTAILASCSRDLPAAQVRLDETCGRTARYVHILFAVELPAALPRINTPPPCEPAYHFAPGNLSVV